MGSLLGMNRKELEKEEEKNKDKDEVSDKRENESKENEKTDEYIITDTRRSIPFVEEKESEYIPIENIRIRRKDEKDMKVPVSFSLSRKTAEQLKQIAYVERLSSSEIVSGLIEAYIHAHKDVLSEYLDLLNRRKM